MQSKKQLNLFGFPNILFVGKSKGVLFVFIGLQAGGHNHPMDYQVRGRGPPAP
jgi:hypothetical protein